MRKFRIIAGIAGALFGLFAIFGSSAPAMAASPAHATHAAHAVSHTGGVGFVLAADPKVGETRTAATLLSGIPTCGDSYLIELTNDNTEAVIGEGEDNPAGISDTTTNTWNFHCPSGGFSMFNGSGNCLAAATQSANASIITSDSTPCTDTRRLFGFTEGGGRGDWYSAEFGSDNGYNVFVYADASGELLGSENSTSFWTNWCVSSTPNGTCD